MVFNLKGKSALVTGASGGIGSAVARALHNQGAELIINGTRSTELEKLAAELGNKVHVLQGDLSDTNSIGCLAEEAEKISDNGIDILVNNAGITRDNLLVRLSDKDLMDVINLNLIAGFHLTRKIIRGMMKRKWGRVIGISSVVGITGNAGQTNYAAAKAGMIGFSKALALEVASRGITVNNIAPGFIKTPMTEDLSEEQITRLQASVPIGRLGEAEDVAAAVVYLASLEASYVTGATLNVNGGMAMP
ncbi:MAG: beta-ketoacyl-ACP reductase [Pseudomonadota bacterium]|jgi:3-oxoacyl-[acyl-carrier protein] reductase|nr:beta-ketoacyl-ACP reductase [Pseudomonadota bacterium]MEC7388852.1 beta-ketoacyl-ACP reductase [Pseudomonadota bacterium]MED5301277.1 beta-ketoacyl-ACP reductase [Pseudomonadota bacterium]|tara:strand:+ start:1235 stop:1978 length:744 start_codon:yes stop_codon:yes gene_type:complete